MKFKAISSIDPVMSETGNSAIAYLLEKSPMLRLLDQLNAFELDATEFNFVIATQNATLQARARGAGYNASAMTVGSYQTGAQKFMGDAVVIDATDRADSDKGLRDVRTMLQKKTRASFRSFATQYDAQLFLGTGLSNYILGLSKIVNGSDDLPGHTGIKGFVSAAAYSEFAGAKSFNLRHPANYRAFVEMIDYLRMRVPGANAVFMNETIFTAVATIGIKLGVWKIEYDALGNPFINYGNLTMYSMLPTSILSTEENSDNSGTDNCSSIYIARLGEGSLSLVSNSGLYMVPLAPDGTMSEGFKYEIRAGWKIEESDSILRIAHLYAGPLGLDGTSVDFNLNFTNI